jgi:hypothetical protein
MLSECLCHLVPLPFYMGLHVVRVSMSLGITSTLCRSLCCPNFLSLDLTAVLYGSLCCPSFYVTWSHFRSVWVSMLSKVLCHLVAHIITPPPPCNTAQVITTLGDKTYYISDLSCICKIKHILCKYMINTIIGFNVIALTSLLSWLLSIPAGLIC